MNDNKLSATTAIIIINLVVFFAGLYAQRPAVLLMPVEDEKYMTSIFEIFGAYSWFTCFMEGEIWRLATYQFLHANLGHLAFNMIALYFFGPAVEACFGAKKFIAFYLLCGIAGALFSSALASMGLYTPSGIPWQLIPMVGASAAIYGIMIAVAFLYPGVRVSLLFPPITLKLRTFALAIIGLAAITILLNLSNAGGEAGHLGGILMGTLLMCIRKWLRRKESAEL